MHKKKLIEVALPLDAINKASAREKSIRHGHPSTLHLWWARRPLAAARAVIFAQMVDDPSEYTDVLLSDSKLKRRAQNALKKRLEQWEEGDKSTPKPTLKETIADQERERLFGIIEELVKWENTTNETVLQAARDEIWQSWRRTCSANADHPRAKELFDRDKLPSFYDPFAGGGALPLEAQRLGLEAQASDLNPVAVLINKAMIEIPPKFAGNPPVNPETRKDKGLFQKPWRGAEGLSEDVRYYGKWMRDEAERRIGHLYPRIEVTAAMAKVRPDLKKYLGQKLTVIAWLWARTVKSPNPAFSEVDVPLASTFMLSSKKGKEAYVQPQIGGGGYRFTLKVGKPENMEETKRGTKSGGSHSPFKCLMSGVPIPFEYIRSESKAGRMGARMLAIVAKGDRARVYLSPISEAEDAARLAKADWKPKNDICHWPGCTNAVVYGLTKFSDLFTPRQLTVLTTFCDLASEVRDKVMRDAQTAGVADDGKPLTAGGGDATAYADALTVYLGVTSSKTARFSTTLSTWRADESKLSRAFARNDIPMTWDYAETNPFSGTGGDLKGLAEGTASVLLSVKTAPKGAAWSADVCAAQDKSCPPRIISTDPPYYDNVPYADLSDFFYVWLRPSLKSVFPDLFATLAAPKAEELVAHPTRHVSKDAAIAFFLGGMTRALRHVADQAHSGFPVTIYYAFKQSETASEGTASTGWETFLEATIGAGFGVCGTWPVRTEGKTRMRSKGSNALASSIVLVCRPRAADAPAATRREFVAALKTELPVALAHLQRGNIAPVDLAQAAIGPGMAVFTRYAKVLDAEGKPIRVRNALALINQTLDEVLAEQESDFDADTRWALAWFEQQGFNEGAFGVAETLSKAKDTSVAGMVEAGILTSKRGKVRLLKPDELSDDWDPATDKRLTVWEIVHHLVRALDAGETAAAELVSKLGSKAEPARELAYRLYNLCERKKRAQEALAYNALVQSWPEIVRLARETVAARPEQGNLFE